VKFVEYKKDGQRGLAIEMPDGGLRGYLASESYYPGTLLSLIEAGEGALAQAGKELVRAGAIDPLTLAFLPPISEPTRCICVGLNYREHAAESGVPPPVYPTIFSRFSTSLIGHQEPIVRPRVSTELDFEGELAVVIGRPGSHIDRNRALDHVAGYSAFNDGSVRDVQLRTSQWTLGKNFDGTGAFGPCFVPADELPAGARGLRLVTRLNGIVVQEATTEDLIFDTPALIAELSKAFALRAGDVIVTGTPSGVGMAQSPQVFMKPGDVCEVEIEGIGLLRNPVIDEA
jgi:acylpyruvate hydrolase